MLVQWNEEYSAAMAKSDPRSPSPDSVERVLAGTFAFRGWIPLLIAAAPQSAHQFLDAFITRVTKRSSALLLPVKPNPKEYTSPVHGIAAFATQIYVTANPMLNFGQNAVALACDAQSRPGAVPEELKSAWQQLVRQQVQDGSMSGGDSYLYEYLSEISTTCFGLAPAKRSMDMISSMFSNIMGGAPQAAEQDAGAKTTLKQLPKPADLRAEAPQAAVAAAPTSEADELMDDEMD